MKIFEYKSGLVKKYLIMALASLSWLACEDDREIDYNKQANLEHADPYLQIVTGFVPFKVGQESYDLEFNAINGVDKLSKVKMYKTYSDAGKAMTSSEVLVGEYDIDAQGRTVINENLTYAELREGIIIDGEPIAETDDGVYPGSGWSFRFDGVYASGETKPLNGSINMVLSKYAGIYVVSNSHYMRIQVDPVILPPDGVANWDGQEVFIGFVDQNTLSYNDRWGYFDWPGGSFNFDYDEDGVITGPFLTDAGLFSGSELATCSSPNAFKNLSTYLGYQVCDESMVIIDNEVTGEHVIKLTYGYLGGGGYRQFTETLTKVVD